MQDTPATTMDPALTRRELKMLLQPVYCPSSGHVVFEAIGDHFGTIIARKCKCGRLVFGEHRGLMSALDLRSR